MKTVKRLLAVVLAGVFVMMNILGASSFAAGNAVTKEITLKAVNEAKPTSGVYIYTGDGTQKRVIQVTESEHNFKNHKIFVFNSEGMLAEAGGNLYSAGPQRSVTVPAGGFMVVWNINSTLDSIYRLVLEGAMLYNSTMTVLHPVKGTVDLDGKTLKLEYESKTDKGENPVKIMFVGNSNTYYNGTPLKFKGLCRAAGIDVEVTYCTEGGAFLSQFADETASPGKRIRALLKSKKYDYVVFQDAGSATKDATDKALAALVPLVLQNRAKPAMYLRYSDVGNGSHDKLFQSSKNHFEVYSALCEKYEMKLIPAGLSFLYCTEENPEINLYADDNNHHSAAASYMLACVWMYSFFDKSPVNNSFTAGLDSDIVSVLWDHAVKTVDEGYDFDPKPDESLAADEALESESSMTEPESSGDEIASQTESVTASDNSEPEEQKKSNALWYVLGAAAAVAFVTGVIIALKKKKK